MSKGSARRPVQVSQDEERLRWIITLTKNNSEKEFAKKELQMFLDTGHVLLKPGNQVCKYCGEMLVGIRGLQKCNGVVVK